MGLRPHARTPPGLVHPHTPHTPPVPEHFWLRPRVRGKQGTGSVPLGQWGLNRFIEFQPIRIPSIAQGHNRGINPEEAKNPWLELSQGPKSSRMGVGGVRRGAVVGQSGCSRFYQGSKNHICCPKSSLVSKANPSIPRPPPAFPHSQAPHGAMLPTLSPRDLGRGGKGGVERGGGDGRIRSALGNLWERI